jgi:hypothetical protein
MGVPQHWFGHRAEKPTLLYISGLAMVDLPSYSMSLGEGTHVVARDMRGNGRNRNKPHLTKPEREHTPILFARWLVEVARRCKI